jgi:hypothetical protein
MKRWTSWAVLVTGCAMVAGGAWYHWRSTATSTPNSDAASAPAEAPAGTVLPSPAGSIAIADDALPVVTVWKSPTCGCCSQWVEHMKQAGFKVDVRDVADVTPYKTEHGVDPKHASCHTAMVGGYVIEGHVPADDIKRLLAEHPQLVGVAAPGMPAGSPGMEAGSQRDRYDVIAFDKAGKTSVWAAHR